MLQNYWENGMLFWSFGLSTVVTDNYIRLTGNEPHDKGYLWNRHSNHMEAFELNVTLQMLKRAAPLFKRSENGGGMGIWYTNAEKFTYNSDTEFFGFKRRFLGVGVILSHKDEISLIINNGNIDLDSNSIVQRRHGYCQVPSLGELHITISLHYQNETLRVMYVNHNNIEPQEEDFFNAVFCVSGPAPPLTGNYRFGVTAFNTISTQATHEIHSVIMTPLSDLDHHLEEEKKAAQVRMFKDEEKIVKEELIGDEVLKEDKR